MIIRCLILTFSPDYLFVLSMKENLVRDRMEDKELLKYKKDNSKNRKNLVHKFRHSKKRAHTVATRCIELAPEKKTLARRISSRLGTRSINRYIKDRTERAYQHRRRHPSCSVR